MYGETRYLSWANRRFGSVTCNLARAGARPVPLAELGAPISLDDPKAPSALRQHIARYNAVRPEQVLPALGTTHALWLAFAALLSPGDDVLVELPGYEPLWRIPEGMGANILRFDRHAEAGFAASSDAIAERLTARTKVVVLTSPHNPSGVRTAAGDLVELARLCDSVGAKLLVDEIFAPFGSRLGADGIWGKSARHLAPNIVAVSGLSKAYGLGSLRCGWLVADEAVVRSAEHAFQSQLADPPLAQVGLAAHAFSHLPALSAVREQQLEAGSGAEVTRWVAARPHLAWHQPDDVPFGFVGVRGATDLTLAIERGAEQHDVLVAPGSFFGLPSAFRLGWSMDPSQLSESLERLDQMLAPVLERAERAGRRPGAEPRTSSWG